MQQTFPEVVQELALAARPPKWAQVLALVQIPESELERQDDPAITAEMGGAGCGAAVVEGTGVVVTGAGSGGAGVVVVVVVGSDGNWKENEGWFAAKVAQLAARLLSNPLSDADCFLAGVRLSVSTDWSWSASEIQIFNFLMTVSQFSKLKKIK